MAKEIDRESMYYKQNNRIDICPTPIASEYQVTHFRFLDTNKM